MAEVHVAEGFELVPHGDEVVAWRITRLVQMGLPLECTHELATSADLEVLARFADLLRRGATPDQAFRILR